MGYSVSSNRIKEADTSRRRVDVTGKVEYCEYCQKPIKTGHVVWLWLDQRTNTFSNDDDEKPEYSQGGFPFGKSCAKHELKKHRKEKSKQ